MDPKASIIVQIVAGHDHYWSFHGTPLLRWNDGAGQAVKMHIDLDYNERPFYRQTWDEGRGWEEGGEVFWADYRRDREKGGHYVITYVFH